MPSANSAVAVANATLNVYGLLEQGARRHPDAVLVGGQDGLRWRTVTATEFVQRVNGLAQCLASGEHGIRAGDRVVCWLPNHWWTPIYFFAIWRLGAVVVPFDREMNPDGAAKILEQVTPRVVLTGNGTPPWAGNWPVKEWQEPVQGDCTLPVPAEAASQGLAAIYFTSGTTGNPKGCQLSHDGLRYQVETIYTIVPVGPGDRIASILPISHVFEMTVGMLYPLVYGCAVHYVPSRRGEDIVRVLAEQHITHMLVVPQVLAAMQAATDKRLRAALRGPLYSAIMGIAKRSPMTMRRRLFGSVHSRLGGQFQYFISGGAALPAELAEYWERLGIRVVQGYGASECSPLIAAADRYGQTPYGSVGRAITGTSIRLSPEGELLVKGPGVFRGYWQDPVRTEQVLTADGWYATGDLVRQDARGNLYIEGRAKDLIVLPSGMKVWPEDVEAPFRAHPAVKDALVLLAPQANGGGVLHAYLLPVATADVKALPAILATANERLAQHQRIATASWWHEEDFPRTALGKVRRQLVRTPEATTTLQVKTVVISGAGDQVTAAVAEMARRPTVEDDATLGSLGLDSLTLAELAANLEERIGAEIPEAMLHADMTVAQLRDVLSKLTSEGVAAESLAALDAHGRPLTQRAVVEANAWTPPLWLYKGGRILRRLSWPITLLHRHFVPQVYLLGADILRTLPASVVFASTHRSFADVPTFQRALRESPAHSRWNKLVIAASGGIMADAGAAGRFVTAAYGLFPIRQYSERESSLQQLVKVLDIGNSLLIFPQGHHIPPEEEKALLPSCHFQPGAALLAMQLKLPVVPVGLAGNEKVVPGRIPAGYHGPVIAGIPAQLHRQSVAVAFGPSLTPLPNESPAAFTVRIEAAAFLLSRRAEAVLETKK